ncbi:hypothetical protein SNOUR_10935 [Streptomyces noursei ATCC 11455]|nr:hypothetical protein SNOUR_10935 [Streptomyces noursei ATCC 11455]
MPPATFTEGASRNETQGGGVATIGRVATSRGPGTVERIRHHFLALAAEFTLPDGQLPFPHTALPASGQVDA